MSIESFGSVFCHIISKIISCCAIDEKLLIEMWSFYFDFTLTRSWECSRQSSQFVKVIMIPKAGHNKGNGHWLIFFCATVYYPMSYFQVGFTKERHLAHFQFHTWTEQEVPDCPAVLEFRRKIKIWYTTYGGQSPLLVHCG